MIIFFYKFYQNENKELMEDNEKYRKKTNEMDAVRADKDELIAAKDKLIEELKVRAKIGERKIFSLSLISYFRLNHKCSVIGKNKEQNFNISTVVNP